MPWLYVTVRLHDLVVEERLCAVTDEVWLGDVEGAAVSFPGTRVLVRRHGERLQVQGRWLDPGSALRMCKGPIHVRLEAVASSAVPGLGPRPPSIAPDLRLFVATAAMVLLGAWFETALRFVESNPVAVQRVQAVAVQRVQSMLQPVGVVERVTTARPTLPVQVIEESIGSTHEALPPPTSAPPHEWPPAVYLDLD